MKKSDTSVSNMLGRIKLHSACFDPIKDLTEVVPNASIDLREVNVTGLVPSEPTGGVNDDNAVDYDVDAIMDKPNDIFHQQRLSEKFNQSVKDKESNDNEVTAEKAQ